MRSAVSHCALGSDIVGFPQGLCRMCIKNKDGLKALKKIGNQRAEVVKIFDK